MFCILISISTYGLWIYATFKVVSHVRFPKEVPTSLRIWGPNRIIPSLRKLTTVFSLRSSLRTEFRFVSECVPKSAIYDSQWPPKPDRFKSRALAL